MLAPLNPGLSRATLAIAAELFPQGFDVDNAWLVSLKNADALFAALCAHLDAGKRMVVYGGHSDATIFGAASVNHAFRAWHDYHHYKARLPFTPDGERAVCLLQCQDILERYGENETTRLWCRLLNAEVNGQLEYAARHAGAFPVNQRAFVLAYLQDASAAIKAVF